MWTILTLIAISLLISIATVFVGRDRSNINTVIISSFIFAIFSIIGLHYLYGRPLDIAIPISVIMMSVYILYEVLSIINYSLTVFDIRKRLLFEQPLSLIFVVTIYNVMFI